MYCLYWIRLEEHTDIHTEGYVGITKCFNTRMKGHKKNKKVNHLTNAKNKYGWDNLIKDLLITEITLEDVLFLERMYRPTQDIGWNSQQGGNLGVESSWYSVKENSDKHREATSKATREGIALNDTTESRSNRAKMNWKNNRDSYKDMSIGSSNPKAILNEDKVRTIRYELIPNGLSNKEISSMFNVKPYVIQFIRSGKNWKHV